MLFILNPSPCVTLSPSPVILSEVKNLVPWLRAGSVKGLGFRLRVNSVKNLIISTESIIEILPCLPAGRG